MNGFRIIGQRKMKLIDVISNVVEELGKKGVNGMSLLQSKYVMSDYEGFKRVKTKRFSGIISDLKELL